MKTESLSEMLSAVNIIQFMNFDEFIEALLNLIFGNMVNFLY